MKNIKVGNKILLGFGLIIVVMLVILAITVVTSLDRNNTMETILNMNELQTEANGLLDDFDDAVKELQTFFYSTDVDEAYKLTTSYLDSASNRISALNGQIDKLGDLGSAAAYRSSIAEIGRLLDDLSTMVDQLNQNDDILDEYMATLVNESHAMETGVNVLFDVTEAVFTREFLLDGDVSLRRWTNIVVPVHALSKAVDALRVQSSYVIVGMDQSGYDEMLIMLDSIASQVEEIKKAVTVQENKDAADDMLRAIDDYKVALDIVVETLGDYDKKAAEVNALSDSLSALTTKTVSDISTDQETMIQGLTTVSESVMILMSAFTLASIILSALIATYLGRSITRPLNLMKDILSQVVSTGDLHFDESVREKAYKEAQSKDEIGQSLLAFSMFVDRVRLIGDLLETIADRDLSVEIDLISPKDTMGVALKTVLENFNEIFGEINTSTEQVTSASRQVAEGAQSLAQGSTEQAASVQELSSSIHGIAEVTRDNAEMASNAAHLASEIKEKAQVGTDQMQRMMQAVNDINDASTSIGRVIKVIDDIAFQTNILSLNAAVEAARAGQHGKGFAVVAEEVRNLAQKSAEAAKDTGNLIANSMTMAQMGSKIAQETSQSLGEIVEGIDESNSIVEKIAHASVQQTSAIEQVNIGINQVAQVVQQNSATAQESAAASEEMSGQADMLNELVQRFKLSGDAVLEARKSEALPSAPQKKDNRAGGPASGFGKY